MQPGIHPNLPAETYHSGPGVSKSGLWRLHTKTPAHFIAAQQEETDAMRFGTACHMALLEPDLLERTYACLPANHDGRTKEGKERIAALEASGIIALKADDYSAICNIRDRLHADPLIQKAMAGAVYEQSAYWIDPETGELCRCRPDIYSPRLKLMLDLKTTTDASTFGFAKSVANFGYHAQQAWYSDGWERAGGGDVEAFVFIAVERTAPYAHVLYELEPEDVEQGRAAMREALARYSECRRTEQWPAYPAGVQKLTLPGWAKTREPVDTYA